MGRAPRSEAVTMPRKRRVPLLLQNLQQGLLDQSVGDARHAELSDPTVRLGDFDPLDGCGWWFPRAVETECLASAHPGSLWRRRWSSHLRQRCPGSVERVSTLLRDSLGCTPPPLIVRSQPGFRVLASPPMVRSLGSCRAGSHPALAVPRPVRTGSAAAFHS